MNKKLGQLKRGEGGWVYRIQEVGEFSPYVRLIQRLLDLGFTKGSPVEVVHEAPFGGDPFAVRIRGMLIGMRREEADFIEVECL